MAKNIPITAKVGKGLFKQKVTEPVLNVGQAGVYGNNVTKTDPSPAKMMKSPLKQMKSKGTGDKILETQANVSFGSSTPDVVIKGKPAGTENIDKIRNVYNKKMPAGWKPTAAENAAANKREADAKAKDAASGTPDQIIPGENTKITEGLNIFNEGSAKTSFWRRQDDRAVTHTSRKAKRADIQLSKIEAKEQGLKGKDKRDYMSNAKTQAKKEMWESRKAGYKGSRDAAVLQGQQSTQIHDKIKGTYLDPNKKQALEIAEAKIGKLPEYEMMAKMQVAARNAAQDKNMELSQTKSKDVEKEEKKQTPASQMTEDDTPLDKKTTGLFGKKSPLKMKYFK